MDNKTDLKQTPRQQLILEILYRYYPDIYRKELLRHVVVLATQIDPIYIRVGRAHLLVNIEKGVVVSSHFSSIFDYCQSLHNNSMQIRTDILDAYDYQLNLQNMRRQGASEYPTNPLLWQVFSKLLPNEMLFNHHQLDIKVRSIPNFDVIGQVPELFQQIIFSCEQETKTIAELQTLYTDIDTMELHRLFLFCLLTDLLDTDVLSSSFDQEESTYDNKPNSPASMIKPTVKNREPTPPKSGSFLSRLFKRK